LYFAWALINSDRQAGIIGLLCLAVGPLAYVLIRRRNTALRSA
jgi:hypothetical protein